MPRGRKPEGEHTLSNAERQARYRASRQASPASVIMRTQRPTDRRSRPQRWRDAVRELMALQASYAEWLAVLPESLRDSGTAEALEAIVALDFTDFADVEPPRGYGRDGRRPLGQPEKINTKIDEPDNRLTPTTPIREDS